MKPYENSEYFKDVINLEYKKINIIILRVDQKNVSKSKTSVWGLGYESRVILDG